MNPRKRRRSGGLVRLTDEHCGGERLVRGAEAERNLRHLEELGETREGKGESEGGGGGTTRFSLPMRAAMGDISPSAVRYLSTFLSLPFPPYPFTERGKVVGLDPNS
ncbi:hypothetical protein B296_00030866 [Ensete ventricosum]|uniref:Uncharacterized protein n=1 Tax=Ensete ventricosum TaxID=4639 RepID=A0A426YH70_ENSVE|nr:hypothetical protein B296_00030866 [Ensete ventricosum]